MTKGAAVAAKSSGGKSGGGGRRTPPRPKHTAGLPAGLAEYWAKKGVPK